MDKFTDKYLNSADVLHNAVVGFEFEFYCEKSYYKLLELLNRELAPIKVFGYRVYHSSGDVTPERWKIEPDASGGNMMIELITGPLPYVNAKIYLLKVLKLLQAHATTNEKCSVHINISFDKTKTSKTLELLNPLKLIIDVDEEFVYKYFPERRHNIYAKTVKKLIPFKNFDFIHSSANLLQNNLELPDTKYFGINIANAHNGRLEYRYIGGKDYHKKTAEILDLLDYFVILTWNSINEKLTDEDNDKLKQFLLKNINQFKKFQTLNDFIAEFPAIKLQIDKNPDIIIVKTYYEQILNELFDIFSNTYNLTDCIINYDSEKQKIEIVDANVKGIFDLKNLTFVDCNVEGGSFKNCTFVNCDIKNSHITGSKLYESDIFNCKLENSTAESGCVITDTYIYNCLIDCNVKGGVFRSGKLGENGVLDDTVKIVTDNDNYFNQKSGDDFKTKLDNINSFKNDNSDKKNFLKGYGNDQKSNQTF